MLGNYLQQTTSADVIFQMHFSWRFKGLEVVLQFIIEFQIIEKEMMLEKFHFL